MKVHPDREDPRNLVLRERCPTWESALQTIQKMLDSPPNGYRILTAHITRHAEKSGRKCSLTLVIRHIDRRVPVLRNDQAVDWLIQSVDERLAAL